MILLMADPGRYKINVAVDWTLLMGNSLQEFYRYSDYGGYPDKVGLL
jgi:hypothetical protein